MADVTGPISSLPGARHPVPAGMKCDECPNPATTRIQGETDSFGCEMWDLCKSCAERITEEERAAREADKVGVCEWCKNHAQDLRDARDYDEGLCGRLYRVCGDCIKRRNDEAAAELADSDDNYDGYWDDDY